MQYSSCGSQNLCSLALVCRIFSEPALDHLWMQQTTLANILLCMAGDLWEVVGSGRTCYVVRSGH
jgi:hypothetical protein